MENEIFRTARGYSLMTRDSGTVVVNGQLECTFVDSATVEVLNLVDGTKDVETICGLAEKKGIQRGKVEEGLTGLYNAGIIVRKREDASYPEDEKRFAHAWKGIHMDYMSVDILPRIHVIQNDPHLQRITFVPSEKRGDINDLLKKALKYASRAPVIEFLEADTYLDSFLAMELVKTAADELEHDMPYFFFELKRNIFTEEDIKHLLELTKIRKTQILGPWTRISRVFGEDSLHLEKGFKIDTYDDNICIGFTMDGMDGVTSEDLNIFGKFPGIFLFLIADEVKSEELPQISYPLLLKSSKVERDVIKSVLQSGHISFMADDMYRVQRAAQKYYILFTDCGAGKRKVAVTLQGDVYPCADAARLKEGCIGDLKEESMGEILKGKKAQTVRENIKRNFEKCPTCCLAFFCGGCLISERCSTKKEILNVYLEQVQGKK